MKISLNWLSDYIEIDKPAEVVAEILSDLGLPNEGIEYLNDDVVIDVEVTSNRGDCLGHIGIARELAAATGKQLKLPAVDLAESGTDAGKLVSVEILSPELCGRYTARVIEGVKIGPTPEWMRKRLEAVGMRSVNNVVDASNYAMAETGQPPHAFDYKKIHSGKIIVRKAKAGETLISIDGSKCQLSEDMLIIADPKGPVAIAGVMGGLNTEVSDDTTTILLEDAYFHPVSIRLTSRKLNLPSEAAFRFERIVDMDNVDWASKRTAQLIMKVAGGRAARGVVDVYPKRPEQKKVTLSLKRLNSLLGMDVPADRAVNILSMLQFKPAREGDLIKCVVPTWRSDVYRPVDLVEEVARVYGYDKVPTEQKIRIEVKPVDTRQKLIGKICSYLNGCGYYETINVSLIEDSAGELFTKNGRSEHLAVNDISRKTSNLLRQTLICSLLEVIKTNLNFKNTPCKVFEIADTFIPTQKNKLPVEKTKLTMACDTGLRELKGAIEGLIKILNKDIEVSFEPQELSWAQVGAKIIANGNEIGSLGIISKNLKEKYDFKQTTVCAAEIDFEQLSILRKDVVRFAPIPKYPAVLRDLSLVVDEKISWLEIERVINSVKPEQLEEISFIGIYKGKGIEKDKKSLTLSLRFRDEDGTLTHDMVDSLQNDIVAQLNKAVYAVLRTV
jgi:phenylalanyl-tRNA synthetase beta chain